MSNPTAEQARPVKVDGPKTPTMPALPEQTRDALRRLHRETVVATERCRTSTFGRWTQADARREPWPEGVDALMTACGPLAGLYDAYVGELGGTSRLSDVYLMHLARAQEDVAFNARTIEETWRTPADRANTAHHMEDMLAALEGFFPRVDVGDAKPYDVHFAMQDVWPRMVGNDGRSAGGLAGAFGTLAFNQGFNRDLVRWRRLETMIRIAAAEHRARTDALQAWTGGSDEEVDARTAYLGAVGGVVAAFDRALTAYKAGEVEDDATRAVHIAACEAAHAAFERAHAAEVARTGADDLDKPGATR